MGCCMPSSGAERAAMASAWIELLLPTSACRHTRLKPTNSRLTLAQQTYAAEMGRKPAPLPLPDQKDRDNKSCLDNPSTSTVLSTRRQ